MRTNGHNGSVNVFNSTSPMILLPDGTPHVLKPGAGNGVAEAQISAKPEALEFREFPDGALVDLVRNSRDPKKAEFLIWKNGQSRIEKTYHYGGKEFVPRPLDPSLLKAVRLPEGIEPCGGAEQLLDAMGQCLSVCVDLEDKQLRLVCKFVLYTWFQDRFPVAPYLWLIGPYGAGKTTLLRLLQCLCRRGITVSDLTAASLYSLPASIKPTLLIDEFESRPNARDRDLLRLLRSGSTRGGHVVRGARIYESFCAKIVASRQSSRDAALASRAVFISLRPTRKTLPALDDTTLEVIAGKFQSKLVDYRLQNYAKVSTNFGCEVPDFTPRMKDVARALAAPLLGNSELVRDLFSGLSAQDEDAKLNRYGEPEWVVAAALFADCHKETGELTMGNLAFSVGRALAENCETYRLSPRAVGEILRSLGLATQKLGNQGRGLRLTQNVIRQIHQIVRDLGLKRSDILPWIAVDAGHGGPPCALCQEFGLMVRDDGKTLRCLPLLMPRKSGSLYS